MQRNPLKFKALRLIIKEGGIELLKEFHISFKPFNTDSPNGKCKVNHYHKHFSHFLKRYLLWFLLYDPPVIATNLAKQMKNERKTNHAFRPPSLSVCFLVPSAPNRPQCSASSLFAEIQGPGGCMCLLLKKHRLSNFLRTIL